MDGSLEGKKKAYSPGNVAANFKECIGVPSYGITFLAVKKPSPAS
jgi:hypothetical protein